MTTTGDAVPFDASNEIYEEKTLAHKDVNEVNEDPKYDSDSSSVVKQDGVKRVEAVTKVWTKKTLVIMFVL
jgi:hypothetical protein